MCFLSDRIQIFKSTLNWLLHVEIHHFTYRICLHAILLYYTSFCHSTKPRTRVSDFSIVQASVCLKYCSFSFTLKNSIRAMQRCVNKKWYTVCVWNCVVRLASLTDVVFAQRHPREPLSTYCCETVHFWTESLGYMVRTLKTPVTIRAGMNEAVQQQRYWRTSQARTKKRWGLT